MSYRLPSPVFVFELPRVRASGFQTTFPLVNRVNNHPRLTEFVKNATFVYVVKQNVESECEHKVKTITGFELITL